MGILRTIEVDELEYTEKDIKNMNTEQLKGLISFIDNERDLNRVKAWSNNEAIESYIDNLIRKI